MIDPDALAALKAATPQCPWWGAENSKHLTVWPKHTHAQAFRALAYYYGVSFSEMFRLLVKWQVDELAPRLQHEANIARLRKDLYADARVGEDIVPDDLADGVRRLRDEMIPGGREGGNPQ